MIGPFDRGAVDVPGWVRDAVFYQVFPDRFASSERVVKPGPLEPWDAPPTTHGFKGGDLLGLAERLPELAELGITALYLTPIFASASNHRYHTLDYRRVDPLLGGDVALRELLDAAHGRGMRVVLDGVFNHASRGFWPFHHVLENGAASPYRDWFHLSPEVLAGRRGLDAYPTPRTMARIARDATALGGDRSGVVSERVLGYRAWWDLPALPKLATSTPAVREYLLATAEHWLRFGIDGWRLDVPGEIADPDFWREFRRRVRAVNPEAYIVGEVWRVEPDWVGGDRFDALMDYPLAEATIGFAAGRHLDRRVVREQHEYASTVRRLDGRAFGRRLEELLAAYDPAVTAVQLNLLDSHDTPRVRTLCGGDTAAVRLATLVQMTLPGAPCIYYGDEIGLEGHHDPDCRRSFPREAGVGDRALRDDIRAAIVLRMAEPLLRDRGTFAIAGAMGPALAYLRVADDDALLVALNAGERAVRLPVSLPGLAGRSLGAAGPTGWPAAEAWTSVRVAPNGSASLPLPARTGLVLRPI
ncbi:MAG TPA: alpha-amylase family glycosyl hydrolase [Candidatus Limnocylindrales bacterium]